MSIIQTTDIKQTLAQQFNGKSVEKISYDVLKTLCQCVVVVPKKSLVSNFDYIDANMIINFNKTMIVFLPDYDIVAYKEHDKIFAIYTEKPVTPEVTQAFERYQQNINFTIDFLTKKGIDPKNINLYDYLK